MLLDNPPASPGRLYSKGLLILSLRPDRPSSGDGSCGQTAIRIRGEEILQRDFRFEMVGPPQRICSNFVRGIRTLPLRIVN